MCPTHSWEITKLNSHCSCLCVCVSTHGWSLSLSYRFYILNLSLLSLMYSGYHFSPIIVSYNKSRYSMSRVNGEEELSLNRFSRIILVVLVHLKLYNAVEHNSIDLYTFQRNRGVVNGIIEINSLLELFWC